MKYQIDQMGGCCTVDCIC